jgi:hypothetical protein
MRLRGSGGESQEELDALETLSHNGGATFKRILRKLLLMTYHEDISITEALDNNSLQKINTEIDDDDVSDEVWHTILARKFRKFIFQEICLSRERAVRGPRGGAPATS